MNTIFLLLFMTLFTLTSAQENNSMNKKIAPYIPNGWKVLYLKQGDLNKDGVADIVLIIENTDAKNVLSSDGMGTSIMNQNPRTILVLLKEKNNYKLIGKNTRFIPVENESACLLDPFSESDGPVIDNGLLILPYHYFYSCGGWNMTNKTYKFRFQNKQMELIGYDVSDIHRSTGEKYSKSINFSTKKAEITSGGNEFNPEKNNPETLVKKVEWPLSISLEKMSAAITDRIDKI